MRWRDGPRLASGLVVSTLAGPYGRGKEVRVRAEGVVEQGPVMHFEGGGRDRGQDTRAVPGGWRLEETGSPRKPIGPAQLSPHLRFSLLQAHCGLLTARTVSS